MRTTRTMRAPAVAAGVLILAMPASAFALGAVGTAASPGLHIDHVRGQVAYGKRILVRGSVPAADSGHRLALQFESSGSSAWRTLSTARTARDGSFALRAPMRRSGLLRVADTSVATAASNGSARAGVSAATRVRVNASFRVATRRRSTVAGRRVDVRGHLLPGTRGRVVRLVARSGRGWHTVARTRTGRRGGFTLRLAVPAGRTEWLRVAFGGDRSNQRTSAGAGNVSGLMYRVASWYYDAGQTACGFHAGYGVANKTLPCGTKVTISYGGRTVVATVDDRGPFVPGRDYDLNQTTAGALGMQGVATVLASR